MNKVLPKIFFISVIGIIVLFLNGCSKDDNPVTPEDYDFTTILSDFTEKVVIATYLDLKNQTETLKTACENYNNNPTQANLDAAANAWVNARAPWEKSEGFLFGPVSTLSLDPSLDTWPLDETQLGNVLNSNFSLTPEFIKNGLGPELCGFHAIEYFLFLNGQHRTSALTEREREYLVSASVVLAQDAEQLYDEWVSGFGSEFKNAGNSGSRYGSQTQAALEIVEGIITIADEVGNGKIGDPYSTKDVLSVESQFSWNSLTDFTNNIRSIKNAYSGEYTGAGTGTGLDELVRSKNQNLHNRILNEIDTAIIAIGNIPEPFRNNLNADSQIQAAINACNVILATFESDVKPLVSQ
jgi:putative iron-regulated protein